MDSVRRNVLDTLRTMFIWMTLTIIHYTYDTSYGEEWTSWSLVQLLGFGVLVCGLFTYYKVVTLPCFDYPTDQPIVVPVKQGTPIGTPIGGMRTPGTPSQRRLIPSADADN